MSESSPRERATIKFLFSISGLILLFLTPIAFVLGGYYLSQVVPFDTQPTRVICVLSFILGMPMPIFAINYLVDGRNSWLSELYTRILQDEILKDKTQENNDLKQLRESYNKLQEQMSNLQLEETNLHALGSWKDNS